MECVATLGDTRVQWRIVGGTPLVVFRAVYTGTWPGSGVADAWTRPGASGSAELDASTACKDRPSLDASVHVAG